MLAECTVVVTRRMYVDEMRNVLQYGSRAGSGGGWRGDLPLSGGDDGFELDLRALGACHPMFLVRLRTVLEWHLRDGRDIHVLMPSDPNVAAHLAAMRLFEGLDVSVDPGVQEAGTTAEAIIPLRTVTDHTGIEDVADAFVSVAERRDDVAGLADALHMAIGEFGDNSVSHGRNELGLRIAASAGGEDAQEGGSRDRRSRRRDPGAHPANKSRMGRRHRRHRASARAWRVRRA